MQPQFLIVARGLRREPSGRCHGNTDTLLIGSRMIKMMTVATPSGRQEAVGERGRGSLPISCFALAVRIQWLEAFAVRK